MLKDDKSKIRVVAIRRAANGTKIEVEFSITWIGILDNGASVDIGTSTSFKDATMTLIGMA